MESKKHEHGTLRIYTKDYGRIKELKDKTGMTMVHLIKLAVDYLEKKFKDFNL